VQKSYPKKFWILDSVTLGFNMKVIFLGTNGWYNTANGNTSCILLQTSEGYIILDAGDGLHKIDGHITRPAPVRLFLSHFHIDHISGLHILNKFDFTQGLAIYGPPGTGQALDTIINAPFTIPLNRLRYPATVSELDEGEHNLPFAVACRPLLHSSLCFGYRISVDGKTVAYCPDTGYCEAAVDLARGSDLCITDCSYAPSQQNEEWPHLNPEAAARIAREAGAGKLALVHFDASIYTTLEARDAAQRSAAEIFKDTVAATDDMAIEI
jgi:ribonuclease BN (tRNA processing enzyme)